MYNSKTTPKPRQTKRVCQGCIELFEKTEIFIAHKPDHSIFLCESCFNESGLDGYREKEPKPKKTKK